MTRLFAKVSGAALIIEAADNGFYLYTYRPDAFGGDTWHATLQDAKEQANFSWSPIHLDWHEVPNSISDLHAFGRASSN